MIILSFTDSGRALAQRIREAYPDSLSRTTEELSAFLQSHWLTAKRIIFIGACGIAVRSIAPLLKSKATDPAVVVIDEAGQFVISLVSGHLGGANEFTQELAELLQATPVITTASDVRHQFSIDDWARRQGFYVVNPEGILPVAKKLLAGERVRLKTDCVIEGLLPEELELTNEQPDVSLSIHTSAPGLHLVPQILHLGTGSRKDVSSEDYTKKVDQFLADNFIHPKAIQGLYSIELKRHEEAMIHYSKHLGVPFLVYPASELISVPVTSGSTFVAQVTGIDNVSERCANYQAKPFIPKTNLGGITVSLGITPVRLK